MQSLTSLCVKICSQDPSSVSHQAYTDAEIRYIQELGNRLRLKKTQYFLRLCKYYLAFSILRGRGNDSEAYSKFDLRTMTHWQLAMWAACEVCFGHYHTASECVGRVRQELPFEHVHHRHLEFTTEKFEQTLQNRCPTMKGNVHDWYKVFKNVPSKILLYEDFFG